MTTAWWRQPDCPLGAPRRDVMSVLIVEDDRELTDVLAYLMRREGHLVHTAYDGPTAVKLWMQHKPRLILLDLDIPGLTGWQVCQQVRKDSHTAVIMLTGFTSDEDITRGLAIGADDYVTKPFSPQQLMARIRAVLRRAGPTNGGEPVDQILKIGDLTLDARWLRVRRGDNEIRFTKLEFRLLHELALNEGQVLSYRYIIEKVWGYQGHDDAGIIKGHIRNLRRKLGTGEQGQGYIETVAGVGYMLSP